MSALMVPATTPVSTMDQNWRKALRVRTIYSIVLKRSLYLGMTFLSRTNIVGDNAFGINKHLMNPFSIRNMEHHERIFNYRLSRARRCVENAFGILGTQIPSFTEDHDPEASYMPEDHHNLCDSSQPHQTKISSYPQQPDGLGGPEPECHPRGMEKWQSSSGCLPWKDKKHWNPGWETNLKVPGPLLYLKGWFSAMVGQEDPLSIYIKKWH